MRTRQKAAPPSWRASRLRNLVRAPRDSALDLSKYSSRRVIKYADGSDGKVNPAMYGSMVTRDLGLCLTTFTTNDACECGRNCWWRHTALSETEIDWMRGNGYDSFVDLCQEKWAIPDIPRDSTLKTVDTDFKKIIQVDVNAEENRDIRKRLLEGPPKKLEGPPKKDAALGNAKRTAHFKAEDSDVKLSDHNFSDNDIDMDDINTDYESNNKKRKRD